MVELQPGMIPPQPGPPGPPAPSRRRLALRRGIALALLGGGVALVVWLATFAIPGGHRARPAPTGAAPTPLKIVFPEGFTRAEMAERIAAVDALARREDGVEPKLSARRYLVITARSALPGRFARDGKPRSLEGFLFPATYEFTPQTSAAQLVAEQLQAFRRAWSQVSLGYARAKSLTPYDVLIIASMIEKEVRAPVERPLVAAVIYNRLHARIALGIDATVRYALGVPPTQALRRSELRNPTPYNTRLHRGLPPTPIANPGLASIQAAAHPARVDYLYYVRQPDKMHHFFTANYRAFLAYKKTHGYK